MANQYNAIIKIRRGLDSDRRITLLESGEIAYSIDVKRMFVGDGSTNGGTVIGNNAFIGSIPNANAIKNDIFYNTSTFHTYILSSDTSPDNLQSYAKITQSVDDNTLQSDNGVISIKQNYFNSSATGFLRLSGGTLGGYVTLYDHPLSTYHAATKGFVDQSISNLNLSSIVTNYVNVSGDTMAGTLTLLSTFQVNGKSHLGGGLDVIGNVSVIGTVDLNNNILKEYYKSVKSVVLSSSSPTLSSYELLPEDSGSLISLSSNALSCIVYCPDNLNSGFNVRIMQNSNSNVYILSKPFSTSVVNNIDNRNFIRNKFGICDVIYYGSSNFVITGDLSSNS